MKGYVPLTVLGGSEPFGVEVLGTAGDGVVWGGVCEVVLLPSGTVGWSMEGVGHLAGNGEHTRNNNLASDERTGHRVQKGREEEKKKESGWPEEVKKREPRGRKEK